MPEIHHRNLIGETSSSERSAPGENHLFVVGINDYQHVGKLINARGDAEELVSLLQERYRFSPKRTTCLYDQQASRKEIIHQLREQVTRLEEGDNLVVFFSGHGHFDRMDEDAYWVPVDGEYGDIATYVSYERLLKTARAAKNAQHVLFIVDSCYSGSVLVRGGADKPNKIEQDPSRWLIASGRNEVVPDGGAGNNSPFAKELLYLLRTHASRGIHTLRLIDRLTENVSWNSEQTPIGQPLHGVGHRGGQFIFHPRRNTPTPFDFPRPDMVLVEGNDQIPDFEIGKFPVTQGEWEAVMGNNPSFFKGNPRLPVERVSWIDAQEFIQKLNEKTGLNYRLPRETEWEFAAKGGLHSKGYSFAGSDDLDKVGWYGKNCNMKPHPVGKKAPNELDIYDMSGNVMEWGEDIYREEADRRVLRGGSWFNTADGCRVSSRFGYRPGLSDYTFGFRLARIP